MAKIKLPLCCDCGEEYSQRRADLGPKNCIKCAESNDKNIYLDMAKRIVPAAHKGHYTYVSREANRGFIETMMKK